MRTDASGAAAADTVTSAVEEFAADVRTYFALSPRQLPSRYLYDALGSALFDAICRLPWYRVTRAESGLLERHAGEIVSAMAPLARVVELGAGNGEKLAILVAARRALDAAPLQVHLVDVSRAALDSAARAVAAADVEVVTHQARFMRWLEQTADADDRPDGRTLSLFLGSNIGNFDRPAADQLLRLVRATLRPGDGFLLGADLVKSEADLQLAYDDPLGLTAAFNRNLIVRLNRELDARIDLAGFQHRAVWNAVESRVEMHLVSTRAQRIDIPRAGVHVTMQAGEFIWTESSYKYAPADLTRTLERCGFRARGQWIDQDAGFALTLVDVA
jgi:dimethylhistidine N-methyltransferase